MLMGKNPAANSGDVSGHGSDHCLNPISCPFLFADYRIGFRFGGQQKVPGREPRDSILSAVI
jgi:hypothetical protein